jgi:hypothetical protein
VVSYCLLERNDDVTMNNHENSVAYFVVSLVVYGLKSLMCSLRTDDQAIGCVKHKRFIPSQIMASWVIFVSNPIFVDPGHASMDVWVGSPRVICLA